MLKRTKRVQAGTIRDACGSLLHTLRDVEDGAVTSSRYGVAAFMNGELGLSDTGVRGQTQHWLKPFNPVQSSSSRVLSEQ